MSKQKYAVTSVDTMPLAKFGCTLGGVAMLLPGIVCAVVVTQVIAALRTLLDEWESVPAEFGGFGLPVEFDFIQLLSIEAVQALIVNLDDQQAVVAVLIVLISMLAGGLLIMLIVLLVGWTYNLLARMTGGLEVELRQ